MNFKGSERFWGDGDHLTVFVHNSFETAKFFNSFDHSSSVFDHLLGN